MQPQRPARIRIYHKSLWARYKGAIFTRLYQLSEKRGIEISFVHVAETDAIRSELGSADGTYHRYPYQILIRGSYEDASRLNRISLLASDLLRNPADLVVLPGYDRVENWGMLLVCILLRRRRAVFCDSTINDRPQVRWKTWAKRLFFSWCDGYVGYGQRTREYLLRLGANAQNIVVPCVAAALPHNYDRSEVLSRYAQGCSDIVSRPRFLYVGRLAPEKGLLDLVDAFALVQADLPAARLDLIGDGALRAVVVARLGTLGLADVVTLHGTMELSDIAPQYFLSVALVLPSHSEPWGLVANESLSYGCPVVISDRCGCVPELVIDGVTGYAFKTGDVRALAAAMLASLRLSADRPTTARHCINVAAALSPEGAAKRMLEGCVRLLADRK
jgi:glycosyltransferase involved in cell wall biosynthesis